MTYSINKNSFFLLFVNILFFYILLGPNPFFTAGVAENSNIEGAGDFFKQLLLPSLLFFLVLTSSASLKSIKGIFFGNYAFVCFLLLAVLSVMWSDFPEFTLRRVVLFLVLSFICVYISANMTMKDIVVSLSNVLLLILCLRR